MTTILEECRDHAERSILEYLRFVEGLDALSVDDAETLISSANFEEVWLGVALSRLVTARFWWPRLRGDDDTDRFAMEVTASAAPDRWCAMLVQGLGVVDDPLPLVQDLWSRLSHDDCARRRLTEVACNTIELLTQHRDRRVRACAAHLSLLRSRTSDAIVAATREALAGLATADSDSYDEQVWGEEFLRAIANVGAPLCSLAPDIAPLLASSSQAFRAEAARAAGALGDPSLLPALKHAEEAQSTMKPRPHDFQICAVRAMVRLGIFQLTGEQAFLEGALSDADRSQDTFIIFVPRLAAALGRAPLGHRQLYELERALERPNFQPDAWRRLATAGPIAKPLLERLAPPKGNAEMECSYSEAMWRAGLLDRAAFVAALETRLSAGSSAWATYVALDLGTPSWTQRIRDGLKNGALDGSVLSRHPAVGRKFVREMAALRMDTYVTALWSALPSDVFWAAADTTST